jgi:hypothetical protein
MTCRAIGQALGCHRRKPFHAAGSRPAEACLLCSRPAPRISTKSIPGCFCSRERCNRNRRSRAGHERATHENKTGDAPPGECIAPKRKNLAFIFHVAWPWSAHLAEAENAARFAL